MKLQQCPPINLTPYSTKHPTRINFFRQTNVNVRTPLFALNKFRERIHTNLGTRVRQGACVGNVHIRQYKGRNMHM